MVTGEQNSKIDKLTKENFDLKLKIHFLDQALQNRSDEGIKDMINANVSFQTDLAKERRDNQSLRRRIRELERQLSDTEEQLADAREAHNDARLNSHEEMEIEISELREQLDHAQVRITKLSAENLAKEMEKRKMGEYMSSMQERKGNVVGEDEIDMWRDLLTEEQGRREMAEDEARNMREELAKLRAERTKKQSEEDRERSERSRSAASGLTEDRNDNGSRSSTTLVERLRHENTELRRDLGAQSSMLTSRNKERERLQQEIEDLKISNRKAGDSRSLTGDSIFERSASRALRAPSRTSGLTGDGRMDESERDEYERREGLLRDENAQLRLEFQDLEKEAEARMYYITQLEEDLKNAGMDLSAAVGDLRALQKERDEALTVLEMREGELDKLNEDYRRLEEEAVLNIEGLEENMAEYENNRSKVAGELKRRNEDFSQLQTELRALATKLVDFEGDRAASVNRIEVLEQEIDEATQELESFERKLRDSEQKNQRLEVQYESLQNEISFLREEQEADKVKIGDLSNALHAAQQAVQDEKEKMQELEGSLIEERRQRELIDDRSNQEVQKVIADLNSDNARSRDDLRRLKRNLSGKESEAETHRTRLEELQTNLRRALGDMAGSRSTLLQDVEKLQHDLERTGQDLEAAQNDIADKERLIKSRDVLLESSGLEARRLSDLLDKERQARKHDLHNFEMSQRGNSTHLRAIANHESRTIELESALSQAKRRAALAENTYKEQLAERNALLLSLWNRLSTLCGADWSQQHGSLNGSVTNIDNIGKFWTLFQRNILNATKYIESLFSGLRTRIRTAERQMTKDVAALNTALESRVRQLEQLERSVSEVTQVNTQLRTAIANAKEEINKLRVEIKALKNELKVHRSFPSSEAAERLGSDAPNHTRRSSMLGLVLGDGTSRSGSRDSTADQGGTGSRLSPANLANKFLRHHSEGSQSQQQQQQQQQPRPSADFSAIAPDNASTASGGQTTNDQRWLHRIRELERRLKAEREARLLDRRGARERLDASNGELELMRAELDRQRQRSISAWGEDDERVEQDIGSLAGGPAELDALETAASPHRQHRGRD
ncbi:hypothetical protein ANO11243_011500 [Dothideomycetidae sp. 11243]|nr:hypothetical protein ANO11243_011500 [fungal sp. No.11243]